MDLNHLLMLLWSLVANWCSLVGHLHFHFHPAHLVRCSCFPKFVDLCTFWYQPEEQSHAMGHSKVTLLPKYSRKSTFHREVLISSWVSVYMCTLGNLSNTWDRTYDFLSPESFLSLFYLFFLLKTCWVIRWTKKSMNFFAAMCVLQFSLDLKLSLTVAATVMYFCGSVMEHMQFP